MPQHEPKIAQGGFPARVVRFPLTNNSFKNSDNEQCAGNVSCTNGEQKDKLAEMTEKLISQLNADSADKNKDEIMIN